MALPIVCQATSFRGWSAALLLCAVACARTGLNPGELTEGEPGNADVSSSGTHAVVQQTTGGAPQGGAGGVGGAGGMGGVGGAPRLPTGGAPPLPPDDPPVCAPSPETCNGRDDDCNGAIDDLPAQACPGGGSRFCVAGRLSECPRRCEVCVAGSVRVCQNSFCSFWGEQECAADGQGFGNCREAEPPSECAATARKFENSKQLEQCCIDNGYCCVDEHDLDGDGDRREMLGACGDIACQ